MKKCKTCGTEKPHSEYYTSNGGYPDNHCKQCKRDKQYARQAKKKKESTKEGFYNKNEFAWWYRKGDINKGIRP